MTYLNKHTHNSGTLGVYWATSKMSQGQPLVLPRSAIKWTPPAAIKLGLAFIFKGGVFC